MSKDSSSRGVIFKDQVGYFSSQFKLLLDMNLLLQLLSVQEVVIGFVTILVFDMFYKQENT
jgi:hypothetical protein